jgi:hypothetical protein
MDAELTHLTFAHNHRPTALAWVGDRLVDPIGGGSSVGLDGSTTERRLIWAFPFDRAQMCGDGATTVLYTVLGTKGLVVTSDRVREINRSYYHADVYEYPVASGRLGNGEDVLVHCPEDYNRLVIERLADGTVLAAATDAAADVFHSRLRISPDGRHLLSAGWVWHPYGVIEVFDLDAALTDHSTLDRGDQALSRAIDGEVESACWLTGDEIVVSANPEEESFDGDLAGVLVPGEIGVWSIVEQAWVARSPFAGHTGTLHAFGDNVLALYEHPKVIDPRRGVVLAAWPDLATGRQTSSIIPRGSAPVPPVAVDDRRLRFAVADGDRVTVVSLVDAPDGSGT